MKKENYNIFSSNISKLVESNKISNALGTLSNATQLIMDESLEQEIILLSNKWERLKSEKSKKTIRSEEFEVRYNQICVGILDLSNDMVEIAKEKNVILNSVPILSNQSNTNSSYPKRIAIYTSALLGIIFIAIASIYYFRSPKEVTCPFPDDSSNYHILLIPFEEMGLQDSQNNTSEGITVAVQNRFKAMQMNKQLPIEVRVDLQSKLRAQTLDPNFGWSYASQCHADLLLSGLFEQTKGANLDSLIITFKYLAVDRKKADSIFMTGMERHAVTSLSSLIHGSFPGKIEDIIYWALGIKAFEEENYASAIQHFDAIQPESDRSQIKIDLAKAEAVQRIGNYTEAFNRYKQLEAQEINLDKEQRVVVLNNLAAIAIELEQPTLAKESMERAVKLAPTNEVLLKNNRMIRDIQIQDIKRIDEISESTANIQLMTSTRVISQRTDADLISKEISNIDTSASTFPTPTKALTPSQNLSLGIKARHAKNYQSAINHLDKVIEETPNQYVGFLERGYSHTQLGRYEEALKDYNQALELQANSPDAFLRRGQLYRQMARYQAAIADFEKLKTLGKSKEAFTHIAFVYADMKSYRQAINATDQALARAPRDQDLLNFKRFLKRKAIQEENN